jgi:hypothetical protein
MKKSVIIAVLGVATAVASYGQGYVVFSSYIGNAGGTASTGEAYINLFGSSANNLGSPYVADLLYSITPISDPVNNALASSVSSLPAAGFLDATVPTALNGGSQFDGANATITGYTATTTVYFEVIAYNGSSYATSTERGRSGVFTQTGLALSTATAIPALGDTGPGEPSSFVAPVPEPTTLALAGLGGLASLVALRRKQA